ncbi:MAG: phosphonate C-P lyase system protein PhnH, partial [Rubrimonas sp.]
VGGLTMGEGVRLTGPGIRGETRLDVAGVDAGFWAAIARNAVTAPLGLDVVLTAGSAMAALPRSVRVGP